MTPIILRAVLLGACATLAVPAALAQCAGVAAGQTEQNAAAELVSLVGRGETRPSGDAAWERAVQAQKLKGGADMRTLALSSAALLLADRTQIRMSANAQLRLCDTQPERSLLELIAGRLWARTKRSPANLQLQTPAALAVVRGTDWDVEVEGSGRTGSKIESGMIAAPPAAISTTIVSPSARITPSSDALKIPGSAEGTTTFRDLFFGEDFGQGIRAGHELKMFIPGGGSAPWFYPEQLDMPLEGKVVGGAGSMLGSGAVVAMDETTDAVAACLRLVRFFARESCGKCTPCREGTTWLERVLRRIIDGYGRPEDLGLLASVGDNISPGPYPNAAWEAEGLEAVPFPPRQTTICPLGPSAVAPITSALRRFRPEFEAYIAAAENNRPRLTVTADPPPADRVDGASAAGGAHV